MSAQPIIQTNHLCIGYGKKKQLGHVMQDITLTAQEGELIALIGRNGIGKSTFLKTITKLLPALGGEIFVKNKNINEYSRKQFAQTVSFVAAEPIQVNDLCIIDLIGQGRHPHTNLLGSFSNNDKEIVYQAIRSVGLEKLMYKNVMEVSDGERQKSFLARALAQDTEIILLDEPTAFLDTTTKYEMVILLHKLARENRKTIIFSSHDINLVNMEADKIWLFTPDRVFEGTPEDIALNGLYNQYFDSAHLRFDQENGEFISTRIRDKKINLTGKGPEFHWTKKALFRLGYEVTENECAESIEVKKSEKGFVWTIKKKNSTFVLHSIVDLSNFLLHSYTK